MKYKHVLNGCFFKKDKETGEYTQVTMCMTPGCECEHDNTSNYTWSNNVDVGMN